MVGAPETTAALRERTPDAAKVAEALAIQLPSEVTEPSHARLPGIPDVMDASRDEAELEAVAAASEAATGAADLAEGVPAPAEDWVPEDETPLRDGAAAEEAPEVPIEEAAEVPIEEAIEAPIAVAVAVD